MSVIGRGVRNAFRNAVRTFSIVVILSLSIAMALAMLLARDAVNGRIESVESSIGNTITISPAGFRGFQGGGEPLVESDLEKVASTPHVVGLTMTLQDRLTSESTNLQSSIEAGTLGRRFAIGDAQGGNVEIPIRPGGPTAGGPPENFTPPIIAVGTTDPTSLQTVGGGKAELDSGSIFEGTSDENVALVGKGLAEKNGLSVGSTLTAYGTIMTVSGIFSSGNTFGDNTAIFPLRTLQRLTDQPGVVTSATVQVDSIKNLEATQAAISKALGDSADVVSPQDTSEQALEPLENIRSISSFSLTGAVIAGAAIIFLTMLMIVRERRREIAVLKAVGAPNRKVISQFVYEALTFTSMAAVIGLVGGILAGNPITRLLVNSSEPSPLQPDVGPGGVGALRAAGRALVQLPNQAAGLNLDTIRASVGWEILGYGLLAAVVITVIGSAVPSYLIARVRPAEVLRGE